ncbi:hypothetical protein [Solimonas marina]|uniref:Lipocalin-like domain-containing protein n=1 Tax=Solimonas marina TaxID=2714601 RepID=A0A969WBP6_9GAMM|nr:hypothetical protein [Solimonas marina]NKF21915.1 hypothetical protein [Solimonas marina]
MKRPKREWPRVLAAVLFTSLMVVACHEAGAPPKQKGEASVADAVAATLEAPRGFEDRVWRVSESTAVAPGTLYAFLSDGTLLVTAPGNKPSLGAWAYEHGSLTMTEQGQTYPTEILTLKADEFRIRSHNPGTPVDITLRPAPAALRT